VRRAGEAAARLKTRTSSPRAAGLAEVSAAAVTQLKSI
jgi:hypothetical protein